MKLKIEKNTNEYMQFMNHVKDNNKISLDCFDAESIKDIETYLRRNKKDIEILEEDLRGKVRSLEFDLSTFTNLTVAISALDISLISLFISLNIFKYFYFKVLFKIIVALLIGSQFSISIILMKFYFKRKKELRFYDFVIRRIERFEQKNNNDNNT